MTEALFLTSDETDGLATRTEYIDAVRDGFRQRGSVAPTEPKTDLWTDDPPGRLAYYGAVLPESGGAGGYMHTTGFAADDTWFVTPLFDAGTGEPLAIIDGAAMNPLKTGATGGVAVDALARTDATDVGIIGSGTQAREQLRATAIVRDLETVRVFSPTRRHRETFAKTMDGELDATVTPAASSDDAVTDADIVITATTATEPVFDGDRLAPGAHVTAMGASQPDARELDATAIANATYVPDLEPRALESAGAFLLARREGVVDEDDIHAELGDVVAGEAPGRRDATEITVFDSAGTAIETVAAAHMIYQRAVERGLGSTVEFAPASEVQPGYGGT